MPLELMLPELDFSHGMLEQPAIAAMARMTNRFFMMCLRAVFSDDLLTNEMESQFQYRRHNVDC
ncbi:MAG TPA: hypothetical protein DHV59_06525 [Oxalobacteraceae bacterium]|nr:hypothetical protein [Oxalobacteraceae bacterium]